MSLITQNMHPGWVITGLVGQAVIILVTLEKRSDCEDSCITDGLIPFRTKWNMQSSFTSDLELEYKALAHEGFLKECSGQKKRQFRVCIP